VSHVVADASPFLLAGESDCSISPSWSHDDHAAGESTSAACDSTGSGPTLRIRGWTINGRILNGYHFRTPDVQGAWIGKKAAQWLDKHYFAPVD
jgi:hypothetical protein